VEADIEEFHNHRLVVLHWSMSKTTSHALQDAVPDFYIGPGRVANINAFKWFALLVLLDAQ
jgi:hypothetical protein